jgi:hypothetical protein
LEVPKEDEGVDCTGGATFILSFTKTRGKTPVPDKLLLFLRERPDGQLEFQFEKSIVVKPHYRTLRAIASGMSAGKGRVRPFQTQSELVLAEDCSKSKISKHISKLEEEGLVTQMPNGYVLTSKGSKTVLEIFGFEPMATLREDPHAQDEIPF